MVLRNGTHRVYLVSRDIISVDWPFFLANTSFYRIAMLLLLNDGIILTNNPGFWDLDIECAAPILRSILLSNIWMPNIEFLHLVPEGWWPLCSIYIHTHIFSKTTYANRHQPEFAFQAKFTTVFKQLISQTYPQLGYRTLPEAKKTGILLRDTYIVFELVVTASRAEFDSYCEPALDYRTLHNCCVYIDSFCMATYWPITLDHIAYHPETLYYHCW